MNTRLFSFVWKIPQQQVLLVVTMELAIQCAAIDITEKKAQKTKKKEKIDKNALTAKLEESKKSPIIHSPRVEKKDMAGRRVGVSEVNEMDRELVKESLKKYNKAKHISSMVI